MQIRIQPILIVIHPPILPILWIQKKLTYLKDYLSTLCRIDFYTKKMQVNYNRK
jgi:hypothetical protein